MIEQQHLDLLLDLNTDENPHTGGALLDHLRGTHDFLQTWRNDQAVCVGGLFHSIYGTQAYRTESASLDDRQRIRSVIGERAERLAFLFCVTKRAGFFDAIGKDRPTLWDRVLEKRTPVTPSEVRDLIEMEIANYLEFMPRLEFTNEELDGFEARIESAKNLITASAYDAAKAAIESKCRSIGSAAPS